MELTILSESCHFHVVISDNYIKVAPEFPDDAVKFSVNPDDVLEVHLIASPMGFEKHKLPEFKLPEDNSQELTEIITR